MIRYALLGLLQGLTEFLPVSSSGHLVLARIALGVDAPGIALEAAVHLGTLASLLLYFRRDVACLALGFIRGGEERHQLGLLLVGTIPVVTVGLFVRGRIERAFESPLLVGGMLFVTAVVLLFGDRRVGRALRGKVRWVDAVAMGVAQAAALLPGISRSGATVATGIGMRLAPRAAARFSFLLAIPAIGGASLFSLMAVVHQPAVNWAGLAVAMGCAAASGLVAVHIFLRIIRAGVLWPFALYCAAVALAALVLGKATV